MPILSNRKSTKTPAVMKLITGNAASNPIIDRNYKNEVIRPIEEQKTRAVIAQASPDSMSTSTERNITAEIVSEWVSPVLERFGCCRCNVCIAEASVRAFELLPKEVVKIQTKADLIRAEKVKKTYQQKAMMTLIRIATERKQSGKHKK